MKKQKLTPKQDNFCMHVAKGMNLSDAYRKSYNCEKMKDKTINEASSRLMNDSKISARIEFIKENYINYTMEKHIQELEEAKKLAKITLNIPSYVKVVELKGKVKGLYVSKTETKDTSSHEKWLDELE